MVIENTYPGKSADVNFGRKKVYKNSGVGEYFFLWANYPGRVAVFYPKIVINLP